MFPLISNTCLTLNILITIHYYSFIISFSHTTIRQDVVTVNVVITTKTYRHRFTLSPKVHWRQTALLRFPVPVQYETFVTVWLLPHSYLLLIWIV